jgi:hypothetical protein
MLLLPFITPFSDWKIFVIFALQIHFFQGTISLPYHRNNIVDLIFSCSGTSYFLDYHNIQQKFDPLLMFCVQHIFNFLPLLELNILSSDIFVTFFQKMQNFKEMAFDVFIDGCFIICHKKLALH